MLFNPWSVLVNLNLPESSAKAYPGTSLLFIFTQNSRVSEFELFTNVLEEYPLGGIGPSGFNE